MSTIREIMMSEESSGGELTRRDFILMVLAAVCGISVSAVVIVLIVLLELT